MSVRLKKQSHGLREFYKRVRMKIWYLIQRIHSRSGKNIYNNKKRPPVKVLDFQVVL